MVVSVDDLILHQDDQRVLVMLLHHVCSLGHLLSRCLTSENVV
jgi:hypothetical protein